MKLLEVRSPPFLCETKNCIFKLTQAVTHLTYIQEVPGSNLRLDTYSSEIFSLFSSLLSYRCCNRTRSWVTSNLFHTHSNSSFIDRRFDATECIVTCIVNQTRKREQTKKQTNSKVKLVFHCIRWDLEFFLL
jgi:hypothetical protein